MVEIETKTVPAQTVLSLSFTGPYDQTGDKLDELIAWLLRAGHPYSAPPFCIYYDDPEKVQAEDLRAEVCAPIEEQCQGDRTVSRKRVEGGEFACATHQGPYKAIKQVYEQIFAWIEQNGYRYIEEMGTREVFHQIMGQVASADEFMTEVQVPIEKAAEEPAS